MSLESQRRLFCGVITTAAFSISWALTSHADQKKVRNDAPLVKKTVEIRTQGGIGGYEVSRDGSVLIYHDMFRVAYNRIADRLVAIDLKTGKKAPTKNLTRAFGEFFTFTGTRYWRSPFVWDCKKSQKHDGLSIPEGIIETTPLAFSPDQHWILCKGRFRYLDTSVTRFLLWNIPAEKHLFLGKAPKPRPPSGLHGSGVFVSNVAPPPLLMAFAEENGRFAYFFRQKPQSGFRQHTPEATDCATGKAVCAVSPNEMLYDFGERKNLWQLQCKIISSPRPYYPLRYRISPNGQFLRMPDYEQLPLTIVRYNERTKADGAIAIVVTPSGKYFGRPPYPEGTSRFPVKELCRLTEFKGAVSYKWSYKLSPDGKKLAAVQRGIGLVSPDGLNKTSLLIVWDISAAYSEAAKQVVKDRRNDRELQRAVSLGDLTSDRVMIALVANPKSSVPRLRRALGPPTNAGTIRKLIKDLDSKKVMTRERASRQLQKMGVVPAWTPDVAKRQGKPVLQEVRSRAQRKLREMEYEMELRQSSLLRVVDILEHINTPDSKKLLQTIAEGGYGSVAAQAAQSSLDILKRRNTSR